MTGKHLVIPLQDYERIFPVAYSVLEGMQASTGRACIFFSMVGAAILHTFYKKRPLIAAGAAFYRVDDDTSTVVAYGHLDGDKASSSHAAFHSWLQCDGFVIDFMAPVFARSLRLDGHAITLRAKMFQRPLAAMASAPTALEREGDFYVQPNIELTKELYGARKPAETDLVDICVHWYKRPPKSLDDVMTIMDDLRQTTELRLRGPRIEGAW